MAGSTQSFSTWHGRHRRSTARRALALVAALFLVLAVLGTPMGGAVAQESEEGEETALELAEQAYWNNRSAKALPDVLTSEFPPGVLCIVVSDACTDQAKEITGPIDENLPAEDDQPHEVAGPTVQPGSLPTGRSGGVEKYVSAFQFKIPDAPEGKQIARFKLVLTQTDPTYSFDSPATRQAVLAALVGVQTEDPEAAAAEMEKILNCEDPTACPYPPVEEAPMRVEACPVIGEYEAGESQEWDTRPEVDCIFGAEGQLQDDGTWHFDLTMFVQSLEDGSVENNGVLFGPVSADNFAFGDKDTTDNAQVSFNGIESEDAAPMALVTYQDEVSTEEFALPDSGTSSGSTGSSGASGEGTFTSSPSGSSGGQSADMFSNQPSFESQDTAAPAPEAAPEVAAPSTDGGGEAVAAPQTQNAAQPGLYWQIWLLLPIALAALYVLSRSLTAEPALAAERSGAMTRLIEQRRRAASDATSGGQLVQV